MILLTVLAAPMQRPGILRRFPTMSVLCEAAKQIKSSKTRLRETNLMLRL
jgi:hypothetical protein